MHKITLFVLSAVFAVALAEGQYYVPRAYYTIDAEGHESARVPLRRLRRSALPLPYYNKGESSGQSHAEVHSNSYGGSSHVGADSHGHSRSNGGSHRNGWGNA